MNYLQFSQIKSESHPVVCARVGGANTTPFQVAHFVLRNMPKNGGEKEAGKGGARIPFPHTTFPSRPALAFASAEFYLSFTSAPF